MRFMLMRLPWAYETAPPDVKLDPNAVPPMMK